MAKNEANERAAFQGPTQDVRVQRFDTHFLKDGIWYITAVCSVCGLVDEEVPWVDAKTPHHAGVIADQRHAECERLNNDHEIALAGLDAIRAAEDLRACQARNVVAALERLKACEQVVEALGSPTPERASEFRLRQAELDAARAHLRRHEKGMVEAERRVQDVTRENAR